jgi:hypothetical protein
MTVPKTSGTGIPNRHMQPRECGGERCLSSRRSLLRNTCACQPNTNGIPCKIRMRDAEISPWCGAALLQLLGDEAFSAMHGISWAQRQEHGPRKVRDSITFPGNSRFSEAFCSLGRACAISPRGCGRRPISKGLQAAYRKSGRDSQFRNLICCNNLQSAAPVFCFHTPKATLVHR